MLRPIRQLATMAGLLLALTASPASAQAEGCSLLTVQEVEAAFGLTGVADAGADAYCEFNTAAVSVVVLAQAGAFELDMADFPGGVQLTIGGYPAIASETDRAIVAGIDGQLLAASHIGDLAWESAVPLLSDLMELAIPRLPSGIDPDDVARVEALVPATIAGQPVTVQTVGGDVLLGSMDPASPAVAVLRAALTAQGLVPADILLVGGTTDTPEGYGVTAVLIAGSDASLLLAPLMSALSGGTAEALGAGSVGGKEVAIVSVGGTSLTAYAFEDVIVTITAPEDELEAFLAALP